MSVGLTTYNFNPAIDNAIYKGNLALCIRIVRDAKAMQNPKTGRLRNAIMWKVKALEGGFNDTSGTKADKKITVTPSKLEGYVGFNLNYGIYVEFGTRYMSPKAFMRPAIALAKGAAWEDVQSAVRKEFNLGPLKEGQKRTKFY